MHRNRLQRMPGMYTMNLRSTLLFASLLFLCHACKQNGPHPDAKAAIFHTGHQLPVQRSWPTLHDGDLVLRTGNDLISELFTRLNQHDKTFSHCGILMQENGQWMVYHAIGGEENPDEHLRKEPLQHFISPEHNLGYGVCRYPFTAAHQLRLRTILDSLYKNGVRFDMQFNLQSDDRLYCAEMVYKAFNKTLGIASFCQTSMHQGFEYVSTDNLFLHDSMKMLCHVVY